MRRNNCVDEWIYGCLCYLTCQRERHAPWSKQSLCVITPQYSAPGRAYDFTGKSLVTVDKHMVWYSWSLAGNLTTTKPHIKWYGTFQCETPLFGPLDPPIVAKMCKKKMRNHCLYVMTWYHSVAVRKTGVYSYNTSTSWYAPKTRFTHSNSQFPMRWRRPW